jgi:hypothetical protein
MNIPEEVKKLIKSGKKITVPMVLPIIHAYYANGNNTGGSLHVVLDDGNIGKTFIACCWGYAHDNNDLDGMALCVLLLQMSESQVDKIYHLDYAEKSGLRYFAKGNA